MQAAMRAEMLDDGRRQIENARDVIATRVTNRVVDNVEE